MILMKRGDNLTFEGADQCVLPAAEEQQRLAFGKRYGLTVSPALWEAKGAPSSDLGAVVYALGNCHRQAQRWQQAGTWRMALVMPNEAARDLMLASKTAYRQDCGCGAPDFRRVVASDFNQTPPEDTSLALGVLKMIDFCTTHKAAAA